MIKQNTALQLLLKTIHLFPEDAKSIDWIIGQCIELMAEERRQIVDAWIDGNKKGWAMTTDWPEDGEQYYEDQYKK